MSVSIRFWIISLLLILGPRATADSKVDKLRDSFRRTQCEDAFYDDFHGIPEAIVEGINKEQLKNSALAHVHKMLFPESGKYEPRPVLTETGIPEINVGLYEEALVSTINYKLDQVLAGARQLDGSLIYGGYLPEVLIGVHSISEPQSRAMWYLKEKGVFGKIPWVQLYTSHRFANQFNEASANASVVRYSSRGEIRDLDINTSVIHIFGGCMGDCLTRALFQAASLALDYPMRESVKVVVHSNISYRLSNQPLHEEIKWGSIGVEPIVVYEADLMVVQNEARALPEYVMLANAVKDAQSDHYVFDFWRTKDGKQLIVEFVTDYDF